MEQIEDPMGKPTLDELKEKARIMKLKIDADRAATKEAARLHKNKLQEEARVRLKTGEIPVSDIEKREAEKHSIRSAVNKQSILNRTEEQKQNISQLMSLKTKSRWDSLDSETRDRCIKHLHAGRDKQWKETTPDNRSKRLVAAHTAQHAMWELLSDSEKKERMVKVGKASQEEWKKLSDHEKIERMLPTREGRRIWWNSLSDDEKKQRLDRSLQSLKQHWNTLSQEEKDKRVQVANKASQEEWKALEKSERDARLRLYKESAAGWWSSLSAAERKEHAVKCIVGFQEFWNNVSKEEYVEVFTRKGKIKPNKPETKLLTLLPPSVEYTGNLKFWVKLSTGFKNPDFIVRPYRKFKAVIELYGDYWHKGEDANVIVNAYADKGVKCLVVWEHELKDVSLVQNRIDSFLKEVGIHGGNSEDPRTEGSSTVEDTSPQGSGNTRTEG